MNTLRHEGSVVVGFDGSSNSTVALRWAAEHAVRGNRRLLLVNAAGDGGSTSIAIGTVETERVLLRTARRVTEQGLEVVREVAPGLDVDVSTPLQDAREALLDLSDTASIMVLGTRGLGPVRRLLLGSVSTAVSEYASSPVAVVRPLPPGSPRAVVVGVDGGATSAATLDLAFELASTEGRPLDAVHSCADGGVLHDRLSQEERLRHADAHERLLAEAVAGYAEKYPDVPVTWHLPDENPLTTLLDLSDQAAMVVVGSRGLTGLGAVLDSVSRDVAARAACTVVVARA